MGSILSMMWLLYFWPSTGNPKALLGASLNRCSHLVTFTQVWTHYGVLLPPLTQLPLQFVSPFLPRRKHCVSEQACSPALQCCLMQSSPHRFRLYDRLLPPKPQGCITMAATTQISHLEDSRSLTAQYQALQTVIWWELYPPRLFNRKVIIDPHSERQWVQEATAYRAQPAHPMAAAKAERMQQSWEGRKRRLEEEWPS